MRTLYIVSAFAFALASLPASARTNQDVVHAEKSDSIPVNSHGNCVRTKWNAGDDICAPEVKPEPAPAPKPVPRVVIEKTDRTVYFDFNKTSLSAEAQRTLDSLAEKLKADSQVNQARVVGFADRMGSDSYNQKLSEKRALIVQDYLISRGFAKMGATETRWLGETTPKTDCPAKLKRAKLIKCLAQDRRVEVEIDYLVQLPPGQ